MSYSPSQVSLNEKIAVGIDLGTTYTSISIYNENRQFPETISQLGGVTSFPSCVSFSKKQNNKIQCLTGKEAKLGTSKHLLYDSKRLLGKSYDDYQILGKEKKFWTFNVEDSNDKLVQMVIPNPLDPVEQSKFYPEEISAFIIKNALETLNSKYPEL